MLISDRPAHFACTLCSCHLCILEQNNDDDDDSNNSTQRKTETVSNKPKISTASIGNAVQQAPRHSVMIA